MEAHLRESDDRGMMFWNRHPAPKLEVLDYRAHCRIIAAGYRRSPSSGLGGIWVRSRATAWPTARQQPNRETGRKDCQREA